MNERAGRSGDEPSGGLTANATYDPLVPPAIQKGSSALLASRAPEEKRTQSRHVERSVDTPGSDLLQSRGAVAPVVLRRPTPPSQENAAAVDSKEMEVVEVAETAESAEEKARKKRGGRKVREREERRATRVAKQNTEQSEKRGAANRKSRTATSLNAVSTHAEWMGAPGYVPSPDTYGMAFADATGGLYPAFAPAPGYAAGYVPGGYYGLATPMWTSDAVPNVATTYPYQAPVTVPANAPFDINATGTYGGGDIGDSGAESSKLAVNHLAKRLDNLPASLGAEFGSTDDLSAFADEFRAPAFGAASPLSSRGRGQGRERHDNAPHGAQKQHDANRQHRRRRGRAHKQDSA